MPMLVSSYKPEWYTCPNCKSVFEVVDLAFARRLNCMCSTCMGRKIRAFRVKPRGEGLKGEKAPCYAVKHGWRDCKGPLDCDSTCWRGELYEPSQPKEGVRLAEITEDEWL